MRWRPQAGLLDAELRLPSPGQERRHHLLAHELAHLRPGLTLLPEAAAKLSAVTEG